MKHLAHLNVLVLGLGESGLAMARWCVRAGALVRVWDSRAQPPQAATLAAELPQIERLTGELDQALLTELQLVLKSPGLAPHEAHIAPFLAAARQRGTAIGNELDLFARALADLQEERSYAPKVLAVTGTNGKTTTVSMTALLLQRAAWQVALAGNVGPTLLDTLTSALEAGPDQPLPQAWVLELSSFQLDGVQGFEPTAAAVLNITQDHLDWHGSMAAYTQAKARIFGSQTLMVINRDDPAVQALVPVPVLAKGGRGRPAQAVSRPVLSFGLDAPKQPGDFGLVTDNGMAWLVRALPAEEGYKPRRGESAEIHLQRLMPAAALRVRARHNAANALAALALATATGAPLGPMLHGLREYSGEPHRLQFVAAPGGIEAYDDSKGTNVGATVAALQGLGAEKTPGRLVVILGGDGKGQDFSHLAAPVTRYARAVALIGRDAGLIAQALSGCGVLLQMHASLQEAVAWSFAQAQAGDALLLSPACASLDMFRNYGHRAQVFVEAVQAHAQTLGEVLA